MALVAKGIQKAKGFEALVDCTQGILLQDRTKTMGRHGKGTRPPVCWPAPRLSAKILSFPKGMWDPKCLW